MLQDPSPTTVSARPAGPPAPARAHPGFVLGVIAAGALATVALWWHDTTAISGLGGWLTNAGQITGLLAGYAVVVLVALMARIPPLERGIGADRLARWHSMGGRYSVSLIVAHAVLITWGYAVSAHTGVINETGTLLTSYPDVLMATVAGGLFVGVGISSARAARRRLKYETWYFLHFYTYLAIALAFSHQFANGDEFMTHRLSRTAWAAMYIVVTAAILWYRFVTPIRLFLRHKMRVESVKQEAPGVYSVVIRGEQLDKLGAESGQFFRWRFLTRGLWWVSSPYSLSAPPRPDRMRITVKGFGDHSRQLPQVLPGTRVFAEGPYGAMTAALRRQRKVLLIGGGVGITPLRALFETLPASPGDLTLVYRVSSTRDVVHRAELQQLADARGARLAIIPGQRSELGRDPLSAAALTANIPDLRHHDVYICGPEGMTRAAEEQLMAAGVKRRSIHRESFEF